ncbi:nucleotidyltransferase [Endozoicomonas sp. ONNA1]|uniref:nucleotidyltransferase n=2 Tax=Endozoicomonas TaxID=305899 RepID=UPI002148979A|nr:nucleotidyltransferase [Endozoicomonas sp. ONNA1]
MTNFSSTPIVELAAIVANHLKQHGIRVVLVGGLAVEIYSENLYLTKDIDMVNTSYDSSESLKTAMAELGFF